MSPAGIAQLQRSAGNAAIARLLASQSNVSRTTVQRCGSIPPDQCPCHDNDDSSESDPPVAQTLQRTGAPIVQRDDDDEESGGVLDYLEKKGEAAVDAVAGAASSTADVVTDAASSTGEAVSNAADAVSGAASSTYDAASGVASSAYDTASGVASSAVDAVSGVASSAYDTASGVASSAYDAASGVASAVGDAVSDEVQAAKQALGAYLEGKTAEAAALIARLQSQLGTLATMIIPADKLAELNGHIASVNSLGKGLVSLPSIGGAAGGEEGESSASPGAVSGLLASLQSAMQGLSSSSAKSPPVQRLVSAAALLAFEEAEAAGMIAIEVEAIPAVVLAPETLGISIPVALGIAAAIAVAAGLIGYAVYRYTHTEKRPWSPDDEITYSELQQLEPTIAGRPGVDYSVKPADVLADPIKSAQWDECLALHEKYDPTKPGATGSKQQFAAAAAAIDEIKAKIAAGTATSDDYNKFCELLRARIKLAEKLATERFDYVAHGCDDLPWPVPPGETPKTPDERRKGHVDAFEDALRAMQKLLLKLAESWC